jgi:hypothetical protein
MVRLMRRCSLYRPGKLRKVGNRGYRKRALPVAVCECCCVTWRQGKIVQRLCVGISCAVSEVDELCGCIGQHRHAKAIQWRGQSIANRFDIRLLARPAAVESNLALTWWERHDFRSFLRAKEMGGNLLHVREWAYLLQVKTDLAGQQ